MSHAAIKAVVKMILQQPHLDGYNWSLQGLGLLRLRLSDQIRLHIWDLDYALPFASTIHDHLQWGLRSTVIAGRIVNYRLVECDDTHSEGYYFNKSRIKAGYGGGLDPERLTTEVRMAYLPAEAYNPGDCYSQVPEEVHWSLPLKGTVTIIEQQRTADKDGATVYWPRGTSWGTAIPRKATMMEVEKITAYALAAWFQEGS